MRAGFLQCVASLALAALVTAGCGVLSPARAQTALKFSLDGRLEGPAAPFLVALQRGYFKDEGLEVSIEPAANAAEPITRVATGGFDLALGDFNALLRLRDQNGAAAPRAVFILYNRPVYAVIGRKSRGVVTPVDLVGKKLGLPPAENASAAWPIFARVNGVDAGKVTLLNVGLPVREPMLAAGEVDAVTGSILGTPIALRDKGVPADDLAVMQMADYGVELYGSAIIASAKALAEKPDAVRGFLRALVRALKETIRDPGAAVNAVLSRNGGVREVELERLTIALRECIDTLEVRADGIGGVHTGRLATALDQLAAAGGLKNKPKPDDAFDGRFLPQASERRID